ncbi:MAG: hypothetical protein HY744_11660 [Deltaproteobacteria bacterium]|nr:hypothetical protein [Deltaproteobacteria bacterium]
MHETRNMVARDNTLVREALRELRRRLPPGWSVSEPEIEPASRVIDAEAAVTAPGRRTGPISIEARARLDPKGVLPLVEAMRRTPSRGPLIVVSRYLSEATRDRLRERDVGYLDLTGNVRIVVPRPGLFIETHGAAEDPDRERRPARSLRGPKAGRIVRALVDRKRPPGVRELGAITKIDAGYVSRVLAFLDTEALVTRVGRGRVQSVDWPALLRRRARDAPLESRGRTRTYLHPRGLSALVARLAKSDERYAITGGLAAAAFAPTAPARLATIWARDAAQAAPRLGLRPVEAGANVLLIEPGDDGVFEGAAQRDGLWYAAPSQVAVDLLTSPGRGPAEGEELIGWMLANEEAWRR